LVLKETRLDAKAIMQRWELTPVQRKAAVMRLLRVLADKNASHREATSAVKALASLEAQNQIDEIQERDEFNSQLLELARQLGVDSDAIEAVATTTGTASNTLANIDVRKGGRTGP